MMQQPISGVSVEKFNGISPEELCKRSLPDLIAYDLDIVFVNLFPSLNSVNTGKHYADPGNHFWSCLYDSKLVSQMLKPSEDTAILGHKLGSVNMIKSPTLKNVQDLSFLEIKEAQENLNDLIFQYKPKIVAFNGIAVFEVYTGKSIGRDFNYGKQSTKFEDDTSDSFMYVLPSSEARGASYRLLPKYTDKVPFYSGLKLFQSHLSGNLGYSLKDADIMFPKFQIAMEYRDEVGSDSEENASILDENNKVTANGHRFHRLNNLPFSQIPSEILENVENQRKRKKDVVINTDDACYQAFRLSKKSTSVKNDNIDSLVVKNESLEKTIQPMLMETSLVNIQQANCQQQQQPVVRVLNPNSSILNVPCVNRQIKQIQHKLPVINIGSASNNQTLKQMLSQPVSSPAFRTITTNIQPKPLVAHYGQPLKLNNMVNTPTATAYKIVNIHQNQTINEKVAPATVATNSTKVMNESNRPNNTVMFLNNQNKSINAPSSAKQVKILSKPRANQTVTNDDPKIASQEVPSPLAREIEAPFIFHQQPGYIPVYLFPDERVTYVAYELVIQDKYTPSEYYTFNDSGFRQQQEVSDHVKTLNQAIQLNFGEKKINKLPVKRHFSNIQEADSVILNSREEKRECMVNLLKL